jgi:hypothetical protein
MSAMRVQVRSKVTGASGAGLPDVLVELAEDRTTAAELIRRAVEEQVHRFGVDAARCRSALDRQYLSAEEIRAQATAGAVRMPRQPLTLPDPETEVDRAQQAFRRGVFVIFVGGRQVRDLAEELVLRLGEPVVFLRLTPLVGG